VTRRERFLLRPLTALAVAAAGLVGASAAPAVADPGACTPSTGVVVVVDFRPFGGGIERGCDATPTTGFEAIHSAGFPTVGTQHDGPGFVCRIKGLPTAAADPCIVTPPATRYWSYWHSDPGQSGWSYSQLGPVSYRPKAGSVDAWVYGATGSGGTSGGPTFSPSSVRATAPAPVAPPPTTTTTGGGSAGGATGGGTGAGTGGATGGRAPSTAPAPAPQPGAATPRPGTSAGSPSAAPAPSATASAAPDPSATSSSATTSSAVADPSTTSTGTDAPVTDVRAAPTAAETSTGSPWPAAVAIVLVLALGAAAAVVALRRRRSMG
jgi:hypothetical protein